MAVATVGSQQFAGFVDGGCRLIGHIVEVDTDITGVSLIFQDVLLEIGPCAALIQMLDATLAHRVITLLVDDFDDFIQIDALLSTFLHDIVQLVTEFSPCLTTANGLEE